MNNLLTARPSPKSLVTDVPTTEWIDQHEDADKIWALVTYLRDEARSEGYDDGWSDGRTEPLE